MQRARKTFKAILVVLHVGIVIAVSSWAFAQGGGISGSVKDLLNNQGIQGVIITVKDVSTGTLAGTGTTDVLGNYTVGIPALGNYTLEASKPGYNNMSAPDVIELSDMTPNRTVNISMGGKAWLKYKPEVPTSALSWETGTGKSYLIPALEIPAFLLLLNGYDRLAYPNDVEGGKKVYSTNLSTFWDHVVHGPWGVDQDAFAMNQFAHPYQGSVYHGFARSAGLNYWESLLYTNAGSFLWETGGETTPPSINDQIASGIGGSFFGEALFRMASLVLEGDGGNPGFWRELGAAMLSPPTGLNRLAFGDRFKPVFPSHDPAIFWRLRLGASLNSNLNDQGGSSTITGKRRPRTTPWPTGSPGSPAIATPVLSTTSILNSPASATHITLSITSWSAASSSERNTKRATPIEGYGDSMAAMTIYRRTSSVSRAPPSLSALPSSGGSRERWRSRARSSAASATARPATSPDRGNGTTTTASPRRDSSRSASSLTTGPCSTPRVAGTISAAWVHETGGKETIGRLNMGLTVRIYGRHALGIQYLASLRDAQYPDRANSHQTVGTVSLVYTLLGDPRFGAVEWRGADSR